MTPFQILLIKHLDELKAKHEIFEKLREMIEKNLEYQDESNG